MARRQQAPKERVYVTLHTVGFSFKQFPPGSELQLADGPETERLLRLGAIALKGEIRRPCEAGWVNPGEITIPVRQDGDT